MVIKYQSLDKHTDDEYQINILGDEYEYNINNNILNFENVEVIPQNSEKGLGL